MQKVIQCRWSPTLGALEDTHEKIWGTVPYTNDQDPAVFFGVYGLPDFYTLWRHKGKKWILWAGTDVLHFKKGYWLDEAGDIRVDNKALGQWINKYCENWCENEVEREELQKFGIFAKVCPSFLGDVSKFGVEYKPNERPKLYTSVSGDNFEMYGWNMIPKLAKENPDVEFHLYGNQKKYYSSYKNVIVHGRVPKEQMNEEVKSMQGALRLTTFDGFSEILAKSILWGQWPVSLIEYPYMIPVDKIKMIQHMKEPNTRGRDYYVQHLNKFPWNQK